MAYKEFRMEGVFFFVIRQLARSQLLNYEWNSLVLHPKITIKPGKKDHLNVKIKYI